MTKEELDKLLEEYPDWSTNSGVRALIQEAWRRGYNKGEQDGHHLERSWNNSNW